MEVFHLQGNIGNAKICSGKVGCLREHCPKQQLDNSQQHTSFSDDVEDEESESEIDDDDDDDTESDPSIISPTT